jgi:hypothetical protein
VEERKDCRHCPPNHLPSILLVESAGADLPVQSKIFVPGGRGFRSIREF